MTSSMKPIGVSPQGRASSRMNELSGMPSSASTSKEKA
jgi:hypothetical protein